MCDKGLEQVAQHVKLGRETEELRRKVESKLLTRVELVQSYLHEVNRAEDSAIHKAQALFEEQRGKINSQYPRLQEKLELLRSPCKMDSIEKLQGFREQSRTLEQEFKEEPHLDPVEFHFVYDLESKLPSDFSNTKSNPRLTPVELRPDPTIQTDPYSSLISPQQEKPNTALTDTRVDVQELSQTEEAKADDDDRQREELVEDIETLHEDLPYTDEPEPRNPTLPPKTSSFIYMPCNDSEKVVVFDMSKEQHSVRTADRTWPRFCNFIFTDLTTLLVTGGGQIPSRKVYELNVTSMTSRELRSMINPRNHHGLIKIDKCVLAIGGLNRTIQNYCEEFSLESGEWRATSPLNVARAAFGTCLHQGNVYVFGGWDGRKEMDSIESLSSLHGMWQLLTITLPQASQCNAISIASEMLVFAYQAGKIYKCQRDKVSVSENISNEAWLRPELTQYKDKLFSFRSGAIRVICYDLKRSEFTTISIESPEL